MYSNSRWIYSTINIKLNPVHFFFEIIAKEKPQTLSQKKERKTKKNMQKQKAFLRHIWIHFDSSHASMWWEKAIKFKEYERSSYKLISWIFYANKNNVKQEKLSCRSHNVFVAKKLNLLINIINCCYTITHKTQETSEKTSSYSSEQ